MEVKKKTKAAPVKVAPIKSAEKPRRKLSQPNPAVKPSPAMPAKGAKPEAKGKK